MYQLDSHVVGRYYFRLIPDVHSGMLMKKKMRCEIAVKIRAKTTRQFRSLSSRSRPVYRETTFSQLSFEGEIDGTTGYGMALSDGIDSTRRSEEIKLPLSFLLPLLTPLILS